MMCVMCNISSQEILFLFSSKTCREYILSYMSHVRPAVIYILFLYVKGGTSHGLRMCVAATCVHFHRTTYEQCHYRQNLINL